jgi:hypothetical protein
MPRKPRLFITGAIYHVYCRVPRGEFVVDEPEAVASFIHNARRVARLDGWSILAWNNAVRGTLACEHPPVRPAPCVSAGETPPARSRISRTSSESSTVCAE